MKVKLTDITEMLEMVNEHTSFYLDKETGEFVIIDDIFMDSKEKEEAWETLEEHDYYRFPTQYDLHDYNIMASFVSSLSGSARDRLETAISGRGAFRRFKDEICRLGIEEQWYAWHEDAYKRIAASWCRENGIDYE